MGKTLRTAVQPPQEKKAVSSASDFLSTLTNTPKAELLLRWVNGEASLQQLALEQGISCQALHKQLYKLVLTSAGDTEQWKGLATEALVSRIADADMDLESAMTQVDIARASMRARLTRQDFERRRPKLYGVQQQHNTEHTVNVIVHRSAAIPQYIDNAADSPAQPQTIDAQTIDKPANE